MQDIRYRLNLDFIELDIADQQLKIEKGLKWIQQNSLKHGVLDSLALESIIDHVEELLEQFKLEHSIQRIALTSDPYMLQLSELFFSHDRSIDRIKLEHAFNEFIDNIKYYVQKNDSKDFNVFIYFVFIREMMHHLNVISIHIKA